MEPLSTTISFIIAKLNYGLSALFMSLLVLFLRKTPALDGYGRAATACIVGGSAVGISIIFGGALAVYFGMNPEDVNTAMAIGGAIGLVSFTVIKAFVKFFDRIDNKDIVEVAKEVKDTIKGK
jgi:uncharacterized membrane protein